MVDLPSNKADRVPTKMDEFLFDLNGFLILRNALSDAELDQMAAGIEAVPELDENEWHGPIHREPHGGELGVNLQQIYEAGPIFESLIDHPSWIRYAHHFLGNVGFEATHGPLYMDECFSTKRAAGEGFYLHSGAFERCKHIQYRYLNGQFMCGQINILMPLHDVGPGDGATLVIPGSHKSNLEHPELGKDAVPSPEETAGAIEVHTKKGDVILCTDTICHGAATRLNPGFRRAVIYRYVSAWSRSRHGYAPTPELLERVTPRQRMIVNPNAKSRLRPPGKDW